MAKSVYDQRDRRRFIEATSAAMMCAAMFRDGALPKPKTIVNCAGELWDELETQYPVKEEDR
jgi:hypothetical protein